VASCKKNDKIKEEAEEKPLTVEIVRYDKVFFETKPHDFSKLKAQYPEFFPESMTPQQEQGLLESISDPMWRKLYQEVEKRYNNFDAQKEEIERLFKYVQFYYPRTKVPKVYTMINNADPEQKVIYDRDRNALIISLEMYLGKDSWVYEYPEYLKKTFEEGQMLPDIVDQLSYGKIKPPTERDFLSQIIYAGKQMYMKDVFLPEVSDEDKICYSADEVKWCEENECGNTLWRRIICTVLTRNWFRILLHLDLFLNSEWITTVKRLQE
jgi:hypothetical protein